MAGTVIKEVGVEFSPKGYTVPGRGYDSANALEIYYLTTLTFPAFENGLIRDDENIRITETEYSQWDIQVPYKPPEVRQPELGEWSFSFNYTMPGVHIYQSLETVWSSTGARDFKGAINVVNENGNLKVEGIALQAPPETFKIRYTLAAKYFNDEYRELVGQMVGTYNSAAFKGHAAGELLLVSVSGGIATGQKANIEFGLSYIANDTNIPVGDITVPSKKGHDLLWVHYGDAVDSSAYALIKQPTDAYVERVYKTSNFANLGF